jgi:hypothetical protein
MGPERAAYCTVLFPVVALNISVFVGAISGPPRRCSVFMVMLGGVLVFPQPSGCCRLQRGLSEVGSPFALTVARRKNLSERIEGDAN